MNKTKLFNEIFKVKSFVTFAPRIVPVGLVPVKLDFRKLMSHPAVFRILLEALKEEAEKINFDLIAAGEISGIPWGAGLALVMNKPFIYVHKTKTSGINLVEGDYKKGQKVILIDDMIAYGEKKQAFAENLKDSGLNVSDIMVILAHTDRKFAREERWLKKEGINLHYLFTWKELAEEQMKRKIIPKEIYPYYLNFMEHPEQWSDNDKKKWQEYCRVLKNKLNVSIPEEWEEMLKMK
jgi:orotate phosphoribosyltransferase